MISLQCYRFLKVYSSFNQSQRSLESDCRGELQYESCNKYTVLHIFRQVLVWAENQFNHQNSEKSLLSYKLSLISIGMKQKKYFFLKRKIQNGRLEKTPIFQLRQFSIFFCENFMNWSLG